ncbi:type II secretion system minor pseudopilin GspI [Mangrovimicrobium sediminis]|nr:type II secretion system minor pseudopilin GspI [Haliea sp. SAOS-164]
MKLVSRARGFTLIEVMVALAVVALALPALLFALSQQVDGTAYLREKSMAHAVAVNKLAELRLLSFTQRDVIKGRDSGVSRMGERDWYWWVESTLTEVPLFYRVEIEVTDREEAAAKPLYTLVAFLPADLTVDEEEVPGEP